MDELENRVVRVVEYNTSPKQPDEIAEFRVVATLAARGRHDPAAVRDALEAQSVGDGALHRRDDDAEPMYRLAQD
jgi:hypothetical protein